MITSELLFFFIFLAGIIGILLFDLGVFSRDSHVVSFRESIIWTAIWVSLAFGFYLLIRTHGEWIHGIDSYDKLYEVVKSHRHPINITGTDFDFDLSIYRQNLGLEYLTGYLIEYALSIDNVFVMILIFYAFGVDQKYYKRVLFWGILGAIVMRFIFIFSASALIHRFAWVLYLFGLLLVYTGIRMFITRNQKKEIETERHPIVRFASKYFAVYPRFVRHHFWVRSEGKLFMTPLMIVLLVIEFTDVIFAVDSVPAIFSVTKDPFIVFFSNIFAIIGLRSLFFLVMNVINLFHYLHAGLAILLTFIGGKMLLHDVVKIETAHSLYFVLLIIGGSVILSLLFPKKEQKT